jgi:hypothetical protein
MILPLRLSLHSLSLSLAQKDRGDGMWIQKANERQWKRKRKRRTEREVSENMTERKFMWKMKEKEKNIYGIHQYTMCEIFSSSSIVLSQSPARSNR